MNVQAGIKKKIKHKNVMMIDSDKIIIHNSFTRTPHRAYVFIREEER